MRKKILIGSIIAVAIIMLSSFSSVVGKVSSDNELVEFDVEFSGLGKKHTVKLTQQEADEVELLFDEIHQQLENIESREEAEEIFKDAVVELDKFGLLGGMSVGKAQRLVTSKYLLQSNNFCLISGELTNVDFFNFPFFLLYLIDYFTLYGFGSLWHTFISTIFYDRYPLKMLSTISIGYYTWQFEGPTYYHASEGWIWTNGTNGIKEWEGTLLGNINEIHLEIPFTGTGFQVGVKGFIGIQIKNQLTDSTSLLGIGRKVSVRDSNWP